MKKNFLGYVCFALAFLLFSCDGTEDVKPEDKLDEETVGDVGCIPTVIDVLRYNTDYDSEGNLVVEEINYSVLVEVNESKLISKMSIEGDDEVTTTLEYLEEGSLTNFDNSYQFSELDTKYSFDYSEGVLNSISYNGSEGNITSGELNSSDGNVTLEFPNYKLEVIKEFNNITKIVYWYSENFNNNYSLTYSTKEFKSQNEKILFYNHVFGYEEFEGVNLILSSNLIPNRLTTDFGYNFDIIAEYDSEGYLVKMTSDFDDETANDETYDFTYNCD